MLSAAKEMVSAFIRLPATRATSVVSSSVRAWTTGSGNPLALSCSSVLFQIIADLLDNGPHCIVPPIE